MTDQISKRPIPVWIISAFFFFSAIYTLYSFAIVLSGNVNLTPQMQRYLESLTPLNYIISIGIGFLNLSGAITLFMLRKHAAYFFLSGLILSIASFVYNILTTNWLETGAAGVIGAFLSQLLVLAVVIYAFRLRKRGTLK